MTVVHLTQWRTDKGRQISGKEARRVLGISSPTTLIKYRKVLGIFHRPLLQSDLADIRSLQLYLGAHPGINSIDGFLLDRSQPELLKYKFKRWGVDLEAQLIKLNQRLNEGASLK